MEAEFPNTKADDHDWHPQPGENVSCPECANEEPIRTVGHHGPDPFQQIECDDCGATYTRDDLVIFHG